MTILLLTFLSLLLLQTPAWADHKGTKLVEREGVWYYQFHEEPVNGRVVEWYKNGQKKQEATFKEGKFDGPYTMWYENGQRRASVTYKDGKVNDGLYTLYDKQGNIIKQKTYKNGEEVQ